MKKFFLIACVMILSVSVNAQTAKILLHHNGEVTQYNASQISAAMSDAQDGDIVYLSDGLFGGFTVSKAITIIGTGYETRINGQVSINIPGSPKLTQRVLDALNISGIVTVNSECTGLNIRKCTITEMWFAGNTYEAIIDRCHFTNLLELSSYVQGLTVTNSYIDELRGSASVPDFATLVNCNVYYIYGEGNKNYPVFKGNLINCILRYYNNSSLLASSVYMINTLYSTNIDASNAIKRDCYRVSNIDNYWGENTSNLKSAGYLGNDGTVVGMYGGTTPYTLIPSTPTVTSSKITVDTEKKQLNVSIKVQSNN